MKSPQQIQDRITFLESGQKDGIDVELTISLLHLLKGKGPVELQEILLDSARQGKYLYMRDLLWILEE